MSTYFFKQESRFLRAYFCIFGKKSKKFTKKYVQSNLKIEECFVITLVESISITKPASPAIEFCPSVFLTSSIFLANTLTPDLTKYHY